MLSDGYWRRRFGADPNIVGKTLTLNGTPFQVIGVMPPDFVFPYPGMLGPSGFTRVTEHRRVAADRVLGTDGRHQPHAQRAGPDRAQRALVRRDRPAEGRASSPEQAEADMKTIAAQLEQSYPDTNKGWSATVVRVDRSIGRHDPPGADDPAGRHRRSCWSWRR